MFALFSSVITRLSFLLDKLRRRHFLWCDLISVLPFFDPRMKVCGTVFAHTSAMLPPSPAPPLLVCVVLPRFTRRCFLPVQKFHQTQTGESKRRGREGKRKRFYVQSFRESGTGPSADTCVPPNLHRHLRQAKVRLAFISNSLRFTTAISDSTTMISVQPYTAASCTATWSGLSTVILFEREATLSVTPAAEDAMANRKDQTPSHQNHKPFQVRT